MSLRLWDYQCDHCGTRHDNHIYTAQRIPKTIKCECGKRAGWAGFKTNFIHPTLSSLYDLGKDPQLDGANPQSYDDRKRTLKEQGKVELGPPERIDDIINDIEETPEHHTHAPEVGVADSIEDLMKVLQTDPRIDRRHTGAPRDQLLESWGSLIPEQRGSSND